MPDGPVRDPDSPEMRARMARNHFILSPFIFVFGLLFSRWQGAEWKYCLLIGAIGFLACLAFGRAYGWRGSKSMQDEAWLAAYPGVGI